jgi:hypothetical protein
MGQRCRRARGCRGGERAAAQAGGHFAAFEVSEELLPFVRRRSAVFVGGALRAPPGQECQVVADDLVGIDSLVAEGAVDVAVTGDHLGDVRRQAGQETGREQ